MGSNAIYGTVMRDYYLTSCNNKSMMVDRWSIDYVKEY
jgi:hypothetical protein